MGFWESKELAAVFAGSFYGDDTDRTEKENNDSYYDAECQHIHFRQVFHLLANLH